MSHDTRALAAVDYFLQDLEGDALDVFNAIEPPRRKPLHPNADVFDIATANAKYAERLALWEGELAATWLYFASWVAAYSYTLVAIAAGGDADARREAFTDRDIQGEMRREVKRLTESVMS